MKLKWKSILALFGLVSGFLSAAVLPVPAEMSSTVLGIFKVAALPGLAFGLAVYLFLYFFEKIRPPPFKALLWILASAVSFLFASLFTFVSSGDGSPFAAFPWTIYFLSGAIAAFFIVVGFRVFLTLNAKQFCLLIAFGGVFSLVGVLLVQYLDLSTASRVPNYLFFEVWQVGIAFVLESFLNHGKNALKAMAVPAGRPR